MSKVFILFDKKNSEKPHINSSDHNKPIDNFTDKYIYYVF